MRISFGLLVAALSAVGAFAPSAAAGAAAGLFRDAAPRPERLQLSSPVLAPMAFSRFCLRYREECEIHRLPDASGVTQARWGEVSRVNAEVNRAIAPQGDDGDVVHETWLVAPAAGACHDYAVTKRHELLTRKWPIASLLIAVVVVPGGEGHAVLTVKTDRGEFILDNLTNDILLWSSTPYHYYKRQSQDDPNVWVWLDDQHTDIATSSVRAH